MIFVSAKTLVGKYTLNIHPINHIWVSTESQIKNVFFSTFQVINIRCVLVGLGTLGYGSSRRFHIRKFRLPYTLSRTVYLTRKKWAQLQEVFLAHLVGPFSLKNTVTKTIFIIFSLLTTFYFVKLKPFLSCGP